MSNILLETKYVGQIEGNFYLPDYQRGYRWTESEIRLLLDDIYESGGNPYCLQPIVVKKRDDRFELIDGQQRLTTIYLIYKYIEQTVSQLYKPRFTLEYETRSESGKFLDKIDLTQREKNIDYHFIANAFEFIDRYFEEKSGGNTLVMAGLLTDLNSMFTKSVSVIWYEVDSAEDGIELFERLNIGKIPLTSSELVKALFLKDSAQDEMSGRQEEVSLQWDLIEHELRESSLWGFLSNIDADQMPTRIDLILDMIANKSAKNKEKYFTFFHFDAEIKKKKLEGAKNPLLDVWSSVYHVFLTLREWYANHDFYHKIGYLIAAGVSLSKIYDIWRNVGSPVPLAKNEFLLELDRLISESLGLKSREELSRLDYNSNKEKLQKVLLLFNVETERLMDEGKRRFPFERHKDKNVRWSLEHIHAQNSESLKNNKDIKAWLESHLSLLQSPENNFVKADDQLIEKMEVLIDQLHSGKDPGNVRERFNEIRQEVVTLYTPKEDMNKGDSYLHGIANMALLDAAQNAALSNSVFDVKRCRVIGYDREGKYIPICTKHVFFKYYTPSNPSPIFWGQFDRDNYVEAIDEKIAPYYFGVEGDAEENADGEND
ncbi:MAG: DUF262 domain-containing protein [Muribaculaceae bacterium]|nr:DUF262 domain-containing protein [Muribaculaceae bacterium]